MHAGQLILIAVIVVAAVVALLAALAARRRRSVRLQQRFGPEYQRTVAAADGNRHVAEARLLERQSRRQRLDIVPLDPGVRGRYLESWHRVQARFVDAPSEATHEADRLVTQVMRERGYPIEDFEQRAADISVDHPNVVEDYRAAREVALANSRSEADTEALRQALVHYRSLFEELLETEDSQDAGRAEADTSIEEAR